jgi:hypothetical protein
MQERKLYWPAPAALGLVCLATIAGCATSPCSVGRTVTIPANDATQPSVVLDLHLPGGKIESATPSVHPAKVTAPSDGTVTLIAKASDPDGVRDIQLWIGTRTCSGTDAASCSGPGSLGKPTASNRDPGTPSQVGCTERLVSHNVVVSRTSRGSVSHEVSVRGINFAGQEVRVPMIRLEAQ